MINKLEKSFIFAKDVIIPALASSSTLQYGLQYLPKSINSFAAPIFNILPSLGGYAPAATGGFLFFAVRIGDRLGDFVVKKATKTEKFIYQSTDKIKPKHSLKLHLIKNIVSAAFTGFAGVVASGATAWFAGTVIVPAIISGAALAGIVWLVVKVVDAIFYVVGKGINYLAQRCLQNKLHDPLFKNSVLEYIE